MLSVQRRPAPCYAHCDQIVTLYRKQGGAIHYTVIRGVHLDHKKNSNIDKVGQREVNSFLLIIPQGAGGMTYLPPSEYAGADNTYTITANDKVLEGEGGAVTPEEWKSFIPSQVDGLVIVQQIDPKHYRGAMCHLEVGG